MSQSFTKIGSAIVLALPLLVAACSGTSDGDGTTPPEATTIPGVETSTPQPVTPTQSVGTPTLESVATPTATATPQQQTATPAEVTPTPVAPTATPDGNPTPTPAGPTPTPDIGTPTPTSVPVPPGSVDPLFVLADGTDTINVNNDNGSVTLTGEPGRSGVEIATVFSGGTTSDYLLVTVKAEVASEAVQVTVDVPSNLPNVKVDLTITAPNRLNFNVVTGPGNVQVDRMNGNGAINSDTGAVGGTELFSDLTIQVTQGSVDIGATFDASGLITIGMGGGPLTVNLPTNTSAVLSADCGADNEVIFTGLSFSGVNVEGQAAGTIGSFSTSQGNLTLSTDGADIRVNGVD